MIKVYKNRILSESYTGISLVRVGRIRSDLPTLGIRGVSDTRFPINSDRIPWDLTKSDWILQDPIGSECRIDGPRIITT